MHEPILYNLVSLIVIFPNRAIPQFCNLLFSLAGRHICETTAFYITLFVFAQFRCFVLLFALTYCWKMSPKQRGGGDGSGGGRGRGGGAGRGRGRAGQSGQRAHSQAQSSGTQGLAQRSFSQATQGTIPTTSTSTAPPLPQDIQALQQPSQTSVSQAFPSSQDIVVWVIGHAQLNIFLGSSSPSWLWSRWKSSYCLCESFSN